MVIGIEISSKMESRTIHTYVTTLLKYYEIYSPFPRRDLKWSSEWKSVVTWSHVQYIVTLQHY